MPFSLRKTSVKRRPLSYGLMAGAVLSALLVFLAAPLYQPWPAEGADPSEACFSKDECSNAMRDEKSCDEDRGCCISDRCFMPDRTTVCKQSTAENAAKMGFCFAKSPPFELAVVFGPTTSVIDLSQYIQTLYKYSIGIAAVMAAVVMMIGGLMYLTAGSSERVSRGKEFIVDALTGLLVILLAYAILNTLNPETLTLQLPKIPVIKRQMFAGCKMTEYCRPCGEKYGLTEEYLTAIKDGRIKMGAVKNGQACSKDYIVAPDAKGVKASCYGASCACATGNACSDTLYRCRKRRTPGQVQNCPVALKIKQPAAAPQPAPQQGQAQGTPAKPAEPDYMCNTCTPDKGKCSPNGMNDQCCAGFCAGGGCTGGQVGDPCGKGVIEGMMGGYEDQCITRICQTNWGNHCSTGAAGSPCGADNKECRPGYKCSTSGNNECTPGTYGSWCDETSECRSGFYCDTTGFNICMPIGIVKTRSCEEKASVQGQMWADKCNATAKFCVNLGVTSKNFCTPGDLGNPCNSKWHCQSLICVQLPGHVYGTCTDGAEGSPCNSNDQCKDKHCYIDLTGTGYQSCVSGGPGSRCMGQSPDTECSGGYKCSGPFGRCIPITGACS